MPTRIFSSQAHIRVTLGLLGLCASLGAAIAQAATLTDIHATGGLISGTLNGVPFTEQPWLLQGQADLSSAVYYDNYLGSPAWLAPASGVLVTIGVGGTPTALTGAWQIASIDLTTYAGIGLCRVSDCLGGAGLGNIEDFFVNLTTLETPYTKTGSAGVFNEDSYATNSGTLQVTEYTAESGTACIGEVSTCGQFAISGGGAVPEPATVGLLAAGLLGIGAGRKRLAAV